MVAVRHKDAHCAWFCVGGCGGVWKGKGQPLRANRLLGLHEPARNPRTLVKSWWPLRVEDPARKAGRAYVPWKGRKATWP